MEDLTSSHWESTNIFDDDSFVLPYDHVDPTANPFSDDKKEELGVAHLGENPLESDQFAFQTANDTVINASYDKTSETDPADSLSNKLAETHLSEVPLNPPAYSDKINKKTEEIDHIDKKIDRKIDNDEDKDEQDDKRDLFFSLTNDINDATSIPKNSQFQLPKINKNDSLFNDNNEQVINNVNDVNDVSNSDSANDKILLVSSELINQSKSTNTPIKMYKAKRPRRHRRQSISNSTSNLDSIIDPKVENDVNTETVNNNNNTNNSNDNNNTNTYTNKVINNENDNLNIKRRDSDPLSARLANIESPKQIQPIIKPQSPAQLLLKSVDAPIFFK